MLNEDLRPFYAAPLADAAVVKGFSIMAHFTGPGGAALGVAGTVPQLRVITSDVPGVIEGDSAVVAGITYTVRGIDEIGVGNELMLRLERA